MAKLKITKTSTSGVTVDSYVSPTLVNGYHVGGTGGLTSQANPQIAPVVYLAGGTQGAGSIVAQKGAHKFRVTDGTRTATATLANTNTLAAGQMYILCTMANASTFYASRITNKFVYDFAGNKYRYHLAAADSTFVEVANA